MENENLKEQLVEVEANEVEVNDNVESATRDYDENLGVDKDAIREKSREERVEIEEPKEKDIKKVFKEMSLETINIILSIAAIALGLIAQLFLSIGLGIVCTVFLWLAVACLIASLALYIVQVIKDKKVAFTPNLVILILACLVA